ncbi:hypothetical protein D3C80_344570 [compost metagenome]
MNELNHYLANIDQAKLEKKLLSGLISQLEKDFNDISVQLDLSNLPDTFYDELKSRLMPVVKALMETKPDKFFNLLYRIDIPEVQTKKVLMDDLTIPPAEKFTEMILERELKKVVIKYYFANRSNL